MTEISHSSSKHDFGRLKPTTHARHDVAPAHPAHKQLIHQFTARSPSLLRHLLLRRLPALTHPVQDALPILVELQLRDHELAGGNTDGDALAVGLLAGYALDVHNVFEAVD